jgi:hypothetical protein
MRRDPISEVCYSAPRYLSVVHVMRNRHKEAAKLKVPTAIQTLAGRFVHTYTKRKLRTSDASPKSMHKNS